MAKTRAQASMAKACYRPSGFAPSLADLPCDFLKDLAHEIHRRGGLIVLCAFACSSKALANLLRPIVAEEDAVVSMAAYSVLPKCSSELRALFAQVPSCPLKLSLAQKMDLGQRDVLHFAKKRDIAPLGATGMASLRQLLRSRVCAKLSRLEFVSLVEDADWTTDLATVISEGVLSNMTYLCIRKCGVTSTAAVSLFNAIGKDCLPKLWRLDISGNGIGDAGLKAFASAFATLYMPSLKEISMSGNRIGDEGMEAFSAALISVGVVILESLNLSNNVIVGRGLTAFSEAIGHMQELSVLCLYDNPIEEACLQAFTPYVLQLEKMTSFGF